MDVSLSFESFLEAAEKAAHRAMDDHSRTEYDEFALHAGVAVERFAKAVLVSKNPIYIAEMKGSSEMLFHLGGHRKASKVRTIGASEAIARLRTLDVLSPDRELDLLIEVRNGVAHSTSGEQAKGLMPVLAKTVELLLKELDISLEAFWGRWTTVVRLAVDQVRSAMYRDVQVRLRQARHTFEDRFNGLPQQVKEIVLDSPWSQEGETRAPMPIVGGLSGREIVLRLVAAKCPACSGRASVFYEKIASSPTATLLVPTALQCPMCRLELVTPDEIAASGTRIQALTLPPQPLESLFPGMSVDEWPED
ncbi:hypothetical protein ACFWA4_16180 [Streptomyces sp. NPDC060011]|uniref:hypothetical protein n=1 Tax=Streptomyces sp. NPDC060011 TaxID=3347037 RepID=UPI0036BDB9C4